MALDFFAGCLGGCAGIVVGYPLDTVKVHIQTQDHRNPKYRGTWHCFRTLLAQHSVAGLYRGMSSPMAGVALINAVVFGMYGQSRKYLEQQQQQQNDGSAELQLRGHFVAGLLAGVAQSPVASPMELAKTRLQLQQQQQQQQQQQNYGATTTTTTAVRGPVQCLGAVYRAQGLRGVFSGLGVTVLREAPSFGVYFASYELLTRCSDDNNNNKEQQRPIPTWRVLLAGGLAGSASWIVSYPVDVVKSRLQADTTAKYKGAVDCFRKSVSSEGYGCLFRGLSSTILRAFPTNAATFAVVAWTIRLFDCKSEQKTFTVTEKPIVQTADATATTEGSSGYLSLRAGASLALMQGRRHFDEAHHFEWTKECVHY